MTANSKKPSYAERRSGRLPRLFRKNLIVTCPLLFVHEGMDITTLVQWEKTIGNLADKVAANAAPNQSAKTRRGAAIVQRRDQINDPRCGENRTGVKLDGKVFQIKYATSLRTEPNFSAASLTTFTIAQK